MILRFDKYFKLNESSIENNDLEFTTVVENKDIDISKFEKWEKVSHLLKENDNYDVSGKFTIKWRLNLELRDWGVKDISQSILDITGFFDLTIWGDNDDDEHQIEFNNSIEKFDITTEKDDVTSGISVENVSINFEDKTILVSF
jgi:hypothetical protein